MWRALLILAGLAPLHAASLRVELSPRWGDQPLVLAETKFKNAAGNKLSVTRLAFLLSRAQLRRADGQWIGAADWFAFVDVEKKRTQLTLEGIPDGNYTALRFDLGLDPETDGGETTKFPAGHPLHPDTNQLHWSWRKGYVFLAIEGRYEQADDQLGGYSYHLAGQECRGTVEVPVEMDLRTPQLLSLTFDAAKVFSSQHQIDIGKADSTHSRNDAGLAQHMADNAVTAFGILGLRPDSTPAVQPQEPLVTPAGVKLDIPAHFPAANWPKDNLPSPAGVALGKTLFHDTRLSKNNTQSCASCHDAKHAFSDPRQFSVGVGGDVGTRNAMPLFNLAWKPAFFWDGRAATLREQALMPIVDPHEMNESLEHVVGKLTNLRTEFKQAFGSEEISPQRLGLALEQYLMTLISADSKMDRTLTRQQPLNESEARGMALFFTESDPARGIKGADCFHCHGGAHFTNHQFLNNGLDSNDSLKDAGRSLITKNPADRGKFMAPSLRNVSLTAPYMHDGRFKTLEETVEHYNSGLQRSDTLDPNLAKHLRYGGLGLSKEEKADLVAFLKALTDED